MVRYDAVICGAGPSGSTAAKYMAEKGLKVVLLEKNSFPRDKPCGGALRPSVIEEFDYVRNGIKKIPHNVCLRAKMYPPSLQNWVDYRPNKPVLYNIQRIHFDSLLVDFAQDAGAEIRENTEVKKVNVKNGGYALQIKNKEEVEGKVIIGAGGMHDPVARYLRKKEGMPEKWPKSDIGLVLVKEYEVPSNFILDKFGKEYTSYFHINYANLKGYAWTFAKNNALNIGYGAFWDEMKKVDIKDHFKNYLSFLKKEKLVPDDLKPDTQKGALIPLKGAIGKSYSHGMLLLGDAAGFVSPMGGDGIYFGMRSGAIAADVVDHAVKENRFGETILGRYQMQWYNEWGKELKALGYFSDKLLGKADRIIRYTSRDKVLREKGIGLFTGECRASEDKWKILRRIARDFFLYDVFRL
jgi:digeranylgeranylglycerophospholipid reductase